jgi:hypothetical protein
MITFKTYLSEKTMNKKAFDDAQQRLESIALVGFEFEVVVEPSSDLFVAGDSEEPDWNSLKNYGYDDLDDLKQYFDISNRDIRDIRDEYDEWVDEQKIEWIEDNWDSFVDDEEDEEDQEQNARDRAEEHWGDQVRPDEDEWLKKEYGNLYYLFDTHHISPQFGWRDPNPRDPDFYLHAREEDTEADFKETAIDTAHKLTKFGIETAVGDPAPDYAHWGIVQDGSLPTDADIGQGLEIITPPQPPSKAFADMEMFFEFMEQHDITTTPECGLHVGVSIPNIREKLDPLKLALFMGEDYLLKLYNRSNNVHVRAMLLDVLKRAEQTGFVPKQKEEMLTVARDALSNAATKYRTANLTKLPQGYIEFRIAGGSGYHRRLEDIKNTVGRYLTIIEIACDPEAERQEYLKKVAKFLDHVRDNLGSDVKIEDTDYISPAFKRFINKSNQVMITDPIKALNAAMIKKDHAGLVEHAAALIHQLYKSSLALSLPFTAKELATMRSLLKQIEVTPNEIKDKIVNIGTSRAFSKDFRV